MRGWVSIAYLAKPKNLNGGLVARGASGLPFVLYPGLRLAVVPPQLDAPRTLTVREASERADNEALVFFEEIADLFAAELLAGCELLAREDEVDLSVLEDAEELPAWEGWEVHDGAAGLVGEVAEVAERATQPLLTVRRPEGGEALIPLVDEFIVDVDEAARRIDVVLPAGLLDL
ncbi:ribosome maturation factor RimM [Adlercreutzia shanghongiae]|uniref:Ribosome maturation factor RimM n=1 Tax=Adlercreutzia shanghongiae TaxID=3111773 RepID=A0ABU6J049_9ACTN|nr:16S rRNA processing protein RimM [Adlercreutzia sp. R22]MEC4295280.1 16S rRNA processing protein RimM [Adlercreutzia sp. R22]